MLSHQVRELNRNGILPTLAELDQRVLQPIFVAGDEEVPRPSVEMTAQVRALLDEALDESQPLTCSPCPDAPDSEGDHVREGCTQQRSEGFPQR